MTKGGQRRTLAPLRCACGKGFWTVANLRRHGALTGCDLSQVEKFYTQVGLELFYKARKDIIARSKP